MSVTKHGIQGYEYQYKATVLIALLYEDLAESEVFVEVEGGEDALLKLKLGETKYAVEIQVKKEKSSITTQKLVDWLTHFQERSSDNNLLYRISKLNGTITLFITKSRSSDEVVSLNSQIGKIATHGDISIDSKDFIQCLNDFPKGKTSLEIARKEFCTNQASEFDDPNILDSSLRNVLIWEKTDDRILDHEISELLNIKYQIALSRTDQVGLKLLDVVKEGRDKSIDILPLMRSILNKNKIGCPRLDSIYKQRIEEAELSKRLTDQNVILLTGTSLCGKSEVAKKLAIGLFEKGFDYRISSGIEEVERFFSTDILSPKVAILEDPFGHTIAIHSSLNIVRRIENLINNSNDHHKLIVCSRSEILFQIFNTEDIEECKISSREWNDLTILDPKIIEEYWDLFSEKNLVPSDIIGKVIDVIKSSDIFHLPQIGQLNYLSNQGLDILKNKKKEELEQMARHDSKETLLAIKQQNEYYSEFLFVLSLCCNTIESINFIDLAFVLSEDDNRPSITEKEVFGHSYSIPDPILPKYDNNYCLSKDAVKAIEYLEERHLIRVIDENIMFSHPNYLYAGRNLFHLASTAKKKRLLKYLVKTITCLNPNNAHIGSKHLGILIHQADQSILNRLIEIGFLGLDSIFPSVEDQSLIFLIERLKHLEKENRLTIIRHIQSGGTDSSNIYWHKKEIPFISNQGGSGLHSLFPDIDELEITSVEKELKANRLPKSYLSWNYLMHLKYSKKNIGNDDFALLLGYNEAFIRKKVVFTLLNKITSPSKENLERIFNDEHPSVVFSGIRGIFINWHTYPESLRMYLFEQVTIALSKVQIAIRTYNLLATFSIDYSHEAIYNWNDLTQEERKSLWTLWGKLYPLVVKILPIDVMINTARFSSSMDDAMNHLDVETGMPVIEAWFNRIDYQIKNQLILDEFELSVADNLMKLTQDDFKSREAIFKRLINYMDTSFVVSNIKWIIEYWDKLHSSEKEEIKNLALSSRDDIRWIRAVVLNSYSPPPKEITQIILGINSLDPSDVQNIRDKFPKQLLRDCLNVYCGFPQPLWWLAVHHHNRDFWGALIRLILESEDNIGFDICLHEFLSHGVNGFGEDWEDWESIWRHICDNSSNKQALVDELIFNTARCTCNLYYANKLWSILITSYGENEGYNEIIKIVTDKIELLQQTGHKRDLFRIFEKKFLNDVIVALEFDSLILNLLHISENVPSLDKEKLEIFKIVKESTGQRRIRFFVTFKYIQQAIENKKLTREIEDVLLSFPNDIDEVGKSKLESLESSKEYKLDNWIGIN